MTSIRSWLLGMLAATALLVWQSPAESAAPSGGAGKPTTANSAKAGASKAPKARQPGPRKPAQGNRVRSTARGKAPAEVPRVARSQVSANTAKPAAVSLAIAAGAPVPVAIAQAVQQEQSAPRNAALRFGCLDQAEADAIARGKVVDPAALDGLLARSVVSRSADAEASRDAGGTGCLPFAAVVPQSGSEWMMAVLRADAQADAPRATLLPGPGSLAGALPLSPIRAEWQALELSATAMQAGSHELLDPLPDHLRWQLQLIARRMLADHDGNHATRQFRVVITRGEEGEFDELQQVELFDALSGQRLDGVYWIEREGVGGMLTGLRGTPYERLFWQSPVGFDRISRGVSRVPLRVRKKAYVRNARTQTVRIRTYSVRRPHAGIDFVAPTGTPVQAVANGVVVFAGPRGAYGNLIVLEHGQGVTTYYAHLSAFTEGVEPGRLILRGEVIGQVGSTGFSTGPHLHYEIRKDDQYLDPFDPKLDLDQWVMRPEDRTKVLGKMLALEYSRRQREADVLARSEGISPSGRVRVQGPRRTEPAGLGSPLPSASDAVDTTGSSQPQPVGGDLPPPAPRP